MYLGIDCGTQSTKALVWDPDAGIVGRAAVPYGLIPDLPAGHKEQHPRTWVEALLGCVQQLPQAGINLGSIRAIGVSGQQHGAVVLDKADEPIRPAKLWCDTSTQAECDAIVAAAGGVDAYQAEIGNTLPAGFTASKLLWLRRHEPENYARIRWVLLPHDWLNFQLTGQKTAEAGDASGTGYFRVRQRTWSDAALAWIDPDRDLRPLLPTLIGSQDASGTLRPALARSWNMRPDVVVASGSGDNMMAALGAGCVRPGRVVMSLGTSGTVFACSPAPAIDPGGDIAAYCDATGRWLPLGCTMSVTVATEMIRSAFLPGADHAAYDAAVESVPPGADGLILVPFLEGERLPNVPDGTGVLVGLRPSTATPAHLARAAMEGVTFGLNHALASLTLVLSSPPSELVLLGGGAKSPVWRQIVSDVTELPVVCPAVAEGPAFGAALQAAWAHLGGDVASICDHAVTLDEATRCEPMRSYSDQASVYAAAVDSLRSGEVFPAHRQLIGPDPHRE